LLPQVKALYVYPLKSAQGIRLKEMHIDSMGPRFDREWMLVNANNVFISQRTHPLLSQISTELTEDQLIVRSKNQDDLHIDFNFPSLSSITVKIFNDMTPAQSLSIQYDQWFSHFLGENVKLVRCPQTPSRFTSKRHAPPSQIRFPDGYPFLITNQTSLDELNSKLSRPIEMTRFRPNIVIEHAVANQEDQWKEFELGSIRFKSVKACTRCKIIDIDPKTGISSKEVSQTLKQYRTKEGSIIFGNNLIHSNEGSIKVGDTLNNIVN
jgi:uncharacterized protein